MAGALMNDLLNGGMKCKTANVAVRIGHYGLRGIEAVNSQE